MPTYAVEKVIDKANPTQNKVFLTVGGVRMGEAKPMYDHAKETYAFAGLLNRDTEAHFDIKNERGQPVASISFPLKVHAHGGGASPRGNRRKSPRRSPRRKSSARKSSSPRVSRVLKTGPRGGRYFLKGGKKVYV